MSAPAFEQGDLHPCLCSDEAPRALAFLVRACGIKQHLVVLGPNGSVLHSGLPKAGR